MQFHASQRGALKPLSDGLPFCMSYFGSKERQYIRKITLGNVKNRRKQMACINEAVNTFISPSGSSGSPVGFLERTSKTFFRVFSRTSRGKRSFGKYKRALLRLIICSRQKKKIQKFLFGMMSSITKQVT